MRSMAAFLSVDTAPEEATDAKAAPEGTAWRLL